MSAIIGRLSFDPAEILARTVLDQMLDASSTGTLETRSVFAVPGIALGWCGPARPEGTSAIGTSDGEHIRAVADSHLTNAGELFPHVYGRIPRAALVRCLVFQPDRDGRFSSPLTDYRPER